MIRYELLREARLFSELNHSSTGGAILRSMRRAPVLATSYHGFIPPWFETYRDKNMVLGWGNITENNIDFPVYFVVRENISPTFCVRVMMTDENGTPRKASSLGVGPFEVVEKDYIILARGLNWPSALTKLKQFRADNKNLDGFHFDLFPEDLIMFGDHCIYLGEDFKV